MTGRVADLNGNGERRRRGGWRRRVAATGRAEGGDGDGEEGRVAKSLQSKQYMVSSLAQVSVCTQHMARGVSEAGAGIHTTFSPGKRDFFVEVGYARGPCGAANLGSKKLLVGRGGNEEGGRP